MNEANNNGPAVCSAQPVNACFGNLIQLSLTPLLILVPESDDFTTAEITTAGVYNPKSEN
jgi:hypothetical protein